MESKNPRKVNVINKMFDLETADTGNVGLYVNGTNN